MGAEVPEPIRAAGCVVWRMGALGPEVLLAHRDRYDDWAFPKGKRESGETDEECARREVAEETNVGGALGPELGSARYVDHKGRDKVVRYWLMRYESGSFVPNDEVDRVVWLSPAEATEMLTYAHDREILAEASGMIPYVD